MGTKFIVFEGGEGSGKTTQIRMLSRSMERAGVAHIVTREPGGVPLAESIRELLVRNTGEDIAPETELLLFHAARTAHVRQLILPALTGGKWVLCDRFSDSTLVYQGIGRGLSAGYADRLHGLTLGAFRPDLTLLLDIAPEEGLRRAGARRNGETRFESLDLDFHRRVREGFLSLAGREPESYAVIDAHSPLAEAHALIVARLNARFGLSLLPNIQESA